jgi:hypothetical protein
MEFVGGPYDGTMMQVALSRDTDDHTIDVYAPFEQWEVLTSGQRWPVIEGRYVPAGLADKELQIMRMEWQQGPRGDRTVRARDVWVRPPPGR